MIFLITAGTAVNVTTGTSSTVGLNLSATTVGNDLVLIAYGHDGGNNSWSVTFPKGGVATTFDTLWSDPTTGFSVKYLVNPDRVSGTLTYSRVNGPMVATAGGFRDVDQTTPILSYLAENYPGDNSTLNSATIENIQNGGMPLFFSWTAGSAAQTAVAGTQLNILAGGVNVSGSISCGRSSATVTSLNGLLPPLKTVTLGATTVASAAKVNLVLLLNSNAPGQFTEINTQLLGASYTSNAALLQQNYIDIPIADISITGAGSFGTGAPLTNSLAAVTIPQINGVSGMSVIYNNCYTVGANNTAYFTFSMRRSGQGFGTGVYFGGGAGGTFTTTPQAKTLAVSATGNGPYGQTFPADDYILDYRDSGIGLHNCEQGVIRFYLGAAKTEDLLITN
jgi:hypothetical protein